MRTVAMEIITAFGGEVLLNQLHALKGRGIRVDPCVQHSDGDAGSVKF